MAAVAPALASTSDGVPYILWEGVTTADGATAYTLSRRLGLNASVQIDGTFGGATVKLQASNDGTTFFDLSDVEGTAISATAAAIFEFGTSAIYVKPDVSGGTADAVDIILVLRGPASNT